MHSKATFPDHSQPEGSEKCLKKLKAPTSVSVQQRHGTGPLQSTLTCGGAEVLRLRVRKWLPGNRLPAQCTPSEELPVGSREGAPGAHLEEIPVIASRRVLTWSWGCGADCSP